ncbi:cholinesterase 1-like [Spodoptera litura]|uniref:Cholinesterase 1-like n=1 Tax=Spodoptera litura TaxID=69820 RepID=A0A9J7IV49_SPOLT|nr:cholinesterase 1-like [Spodoptera litura]
MQRQTCVFLVSVLAISANEEWLQVNTPQGPVRGLKQIDEDVYAFYNIPYATAPVGVDKFKAPLPPPTWKKPFEALDRNIVCPQNKIVIEMLLEKLKMQENCLVANVFVPDTLEKNLSVLVYVHGGAFLIGYGNMNKGTQLMKSKDIIMVTFNYRLSVHGFLCLGTEGAPGNAGIKDQVALLRWVQENIASYGGNPNDVTLAGSSAGSAAVDLIMLSKLARGLFHRVIPESGGSLAAFAVQRNPLETAKNHAKRLNFRKTEDTYALDLFYRTASLDLLTSLTLFDETDSTFVFSPCVERITGTEAFLIDSPLRILKKGNYVKVPILYGFSSMEGLLRIDMFDIWKDKMNKKFSDFLPADLGFKSDTEKEQVAQTVKKFYFGKEPVHRETIFGYIDFFSDVLFTYPMLRAVKLHAEAGHHEVYLYEYTFSDNGSTTDSHSIKRSAEHGAQSMAWLDNMNGKSESLSTPEYRNMRAIVREIWHSFIVSGKPVPEDSVLPEWPAAGAGRAPYLSLDLNVQLHNMYVEASTKFWDGIYQKYYRDASPPPAPNNVIPKPYSYNNSLEFFSY